jgi:glycosyltransferase involved in cell wall biosynthesis
MNSVNVKPTQGAIRVLHVFSTFDLGGPQARTVGLIKDLGMQFDHTVIAMDAHYGAASLLKELPNFKIREQPFQKSKLLGNFSQIRKLIQEIKPDVLITYNWGAIEWTLLPMSNSIRRLHVEEGFSVAETGKRFLRRTLLRRLAFAINPITLVTVSNSLLHIAKSEWKIAPKRLVYIANGVDTERFIPVSTSNQKADHRASFTFGTVCGLRPEKRLDRLITAFSQIKDNTVKLKIVGDGALRSELEGLTVKLKVQDRVEFLGHQSAPEAYLSSIDAFILASETEQAPISLIEAMSCNLRCVVTNVGDMATMLPPDATDLVAENSQDSILSAMNRCLMLPVDRKPNYRKHAIDNYSITAMNRSWFNLLSATSTQTYSPSV